MIRWGGKFRRASRWFFLSKNARVPSVHAEAGGLSDDLHGILDEVVVECIAPDGTSEVLFTVELNRGLFYHGDTEARRITELIASAPMLINVF